MYVFILLTVVIVSAVSWLMLMLDRKRTNARGPIPFPFIGNGHLLAVDTTEFLGALKRLEDKYNLNVLIHLFSERYIVTSNPKLFEEILTSTEYITKGKSYNYVKPWLGEGLLTSGGQRWKAHRKFLTPAFHFNMLQNFLQVFCKNRKVLKKKLDALADGSSNIDMFPIIALTALDNVAESIMGVSLNVQSDLESEFVKAVDVMSSLAAMRIRNPFVAPNFVFNLLPYKTTQDKALHILHGQTKEVINSRRDELRRSQITDMGPNAEHGIKNTHAFLDLLLLAEVDGKKISDESIREEVDTFMFEGHDTTTSGIAFCLYCLSNRDDIQKKIIEEQKSILDDDLQRDPTYSELQLMKYLELVIKESLRLFPSVPIIARAITRDTNIGGLLIPKDTSIVLDIFNMQRNPDLYDYPLEFIPERFESGSRNPFHWLPFSAGARNCIGQKFAIMEMKVTIAMIVNNFRILPSGEEPICTADLILRSRNGIKVKLMPRK